MELLNLKSYQWSNLCLNAPKTVCVHKKIQKFKFKVLKTLMLPCDRHWGEILLHLKVKSYHQLKNIHCF
jgi:hypothetical protein